MLKVGDIVKIITDFAPEEIQAEYDNSGLLFGDLNWVYKGALITLDLSPSVVKEAIETGVNLIIEHHPTLFFPIKKFDLKLPKQKALTMAIKNDIAIYSAHTSVDFTKGGLNDRVMQLLGCDNYYLLNDNLSDMRIGTFSERISLCELVEKVRSIFNDKHVTYIGEPLSDINKIAVINGGGGNEEEIKNAIASGAQVFISADFKYNAMRLAKDLGYAIIIFGHYTSETPFIDLIKEILIKNGIGNVYAAKTCTNPLN